MKGHKRVAWQVDQAIYHCIPILVNQVKIKFPVYCFSSNSVTYQPLTVRSAILIFPTAKCAKILCRKHLSCAISVAFLFHLFVVTFCFFIDGQTIIPVLPARCSIASLGQEYVWFIFPNFLLTRVLLILWTVVKFVKTI